MSHLHHDTGLPYFGHPGEWERMLPTEVAPSRRATTSSRTPGKTNEGTVWFAVRKADVCTACGAVTGAYPGAHAPHFKNQTTVVDCIGRPCVRDDDGYYRLAEVVP